MENNSLISVIVPIFNVAEYLDACIESIVNQSYCNLEVLLIDDGSTDGSLGICQEWAKRDTRIRIIHKENSGQAESRNLGVEVCRGDLITFVDADDRIDQLMVEKLYRAMRLHSADISMCEAYTENAEGVFSSYSLQHLEKDIINIQKEKTFLLTVRYTLWSKLYKRSLFLEHNIKEPSIKFEDFAVVPIIYALAERVACVNEPLYYYTYREGSTVRDVAHIDDRIMALKYLMNEEKRQKLDEEWEKIFYKICTERGLILMRQVYPILSKRFERFCSDYDSFLKEYFDVSLTNVSRNFHNQCKSGTVSARLLGNYNLAVFGSYNLMIIAKMIMNLGLSDYIEEHDSFASLISITSRADSAFYDWNLSHKNQYREKHLVQDITKSFMHKSPCLYKDIDFLLIDFLEERFNIGKYNESFFTLSDAFIDIKDKISSDFQVVKRLDDSTMKLWEDSCRLFVDRLKKYIDPRKVVLVRMVLCLMHGQDKDNLKLYEDAETIAKINKLLNHYYDYFLELMPEAIEVKLDEVNLYTDDNYRHGCFPWHLNAEAYWNIHLDILREIKKYDNAAIDELMDKSREQYKNVKGGN